MKNYKEFPKRYYTEYGIYFVTANVKDRIRFFREEIFCELMVEELKLVKEIYKCRIFGFVINYDHNHFLIQHADVGKRNISCVMKSIKRNFSRDVNKILGYSPIHPVTANMDSPLPGGGAAQDPPKTLDSSLPGNPSPVEKNPHSSLPDKNMDSPLPGGGVAQDPPKTLDSSLPGNPSPVEKNPHSSLPDKNMDSPLPGGGAAQDPPKTLDSSLPGNPSPVEKNPHSSLPDKNMDSPLPGGGAAQDPPKTLDSSLPGNPSPVEKNPHSSLPDKKKGILNPWVIDMRKKFVKKHGSDQVKFPKFKWQKSFHDHRIRDEDDLADALEYIDINPSRHGIVKPGELYKYCSTHHRYDFIDDLPF